MTINVETKQNLVKISAVNFKHLTKKQQKEVKLRYPDINFDNKKELDGIIIEVEPKAKRRVNKIVKAMKQGEINRIQRIKETEDSYERIIDCYESGIFDGEDFDCWLDENISFEIEDYESPYYRAIRIKKEKQAIIDYYNNKIESYNMTMNVDKKKCIELTDNIAKVLKSLDSIINDMDGNNDIKETETAITKDMIVKFVDVITDYSNHAIRHHLDSYKYNKEHLILLENSYDENCHSEEDHNNFCDAINERESIMNLHKQELIHLITKQLTNN